MKINWLVICIAVVAVAEGAYIYSRSGDFQAGWQAGRCYDWKDKIRTPQYYGFDRSKIFDAERESFERECDAVASWSRK